MKKILAAVLALALVLGVTATAFANNAELEIDVEDLLINSGEMPEPGKYQVPVNYQNETVRVVGANGFNLSKATVGKSVEFILEKSNDVTASVFYKGKEIEPNESGVYRIEKIAFLESINITTKGQSKDQDHLPGKTADDKDLTCYNPEVYSQKFYNGNVVYQEAVMFSKSKDDKSLYPNWDQTTKKLLYPVDDVISVRSNDLKTFYVKDVDYKVNDDGTLTWLEGSQIPLYTGRFILSTKEPSPDTPPDMTSSNTSVTKFYGLDPDKSQEEQEWGLNLLNDEQHEKFTVYITYRHTRTWDGINYVAGLKRQGNKIAKFHDKIVTGQDINILVYGDSVATGAASSGRNAGYDSLTEKESGDGTLTYTWKAKTTGVAEPYAPTFFEQATQAIVEKYKKNNIINYYNIAQGGKSSGWGASALENRIAEMNKKFGVVNPDLIYLKFSANEVSISKASYKLNHKKIIQTLQKHYPDAAIVLVSGKINNERCERVYGKYHQTAMEHEKALEELTNEFENCIVAKITGVWNEITKVKDYTDYLSNNINHANDFWAKTTAQIIVQAMQIENGDVNNDSAVDLKDVVLITKYCLNKTPLQNPKAADCNNDGKVDLKDAAYLAQCVAGWKD